MFSSISDSAANIRNTNVFITVSDDGLVLSSAMWSTCTVLTLKLDLIFSGFSGIILWMRPVTERRRYIVTPSLIGWVHTQNDPCLWLFLLFLLSLSLSLLLLLLLLFYYYYYHHYHYHYYYYGYYYYYHYHYHYHYHYYLSLLHFRISDNVIEDGHHIYRKTYYIIFLCKIAQARQWLMLQTKHFMNSPKTLRNLLSSAHDDVIKWKHFLILARVSRCQNVPITIALLRRTISDDPVHKGIYAALDPNRLIWKVNIHISMA